MYTSNFSICLVSLFFLMFLFGLYFSKKNANNIENKIYRQLLVWTAFASLTYIVFLIFVNWFPEYLNIIAFFLKLYFVTANVWYYCLSIYILIITNENNNKVANFVKSNKRRLLRVAIIVIILLDVIQLLLPVNVIKNSDGVILAEFKSGVIYGNACPAFYLLMALISFLLIEKSQVKRKYFLLN